MLASAPVRAAGERVAGLCRCSARRSRFCALFGGGPSDAPLVWIGGLALLLGARAPRCARRRDSGPAMLLLGSLFGLAVWSGLSTLWSISPDRTWTTRTGRSSTPPSRSSGVLVGARVSRERLAEGAALLLARSSSSALVAKCVPALYSDYGRVARLRAPLGYWNELALLCAAGVPVALWLARVRRRATRGVAAPLRARRHAAPDVLALRGRARLRRGRSRGCCSTAESRREPRRGRSSPAAREGRRSRSRLRCPGSPMICSRGHVRVHDSWIFALVLVAVRRSSVCPARALRTREATRERRARIERGAAIAASCCSSRSSLLSIVFAGRLWSDFTNPARPVSNSTRHLGSARSNRWTWWQEAWHAFTRHPFGGTGAGTFELTNQMLRRRPIVVGRAAQRRRCSSSARPASSASCSTSAPPPARSGAHGARGATRPGSRSGLPSPRSSCTRSSTRTGTTSRPAGRCSSSPAHSLARPPAGGAARGPPPARLPSAPSQSRSPAIYSLAAPWLAQRSRTRATRTRERRRALLRPADRSTRSSTGRRSRTRRGYSPQAARSTATPSTLEPENAETGTQLGAFYFRYKAVAATRTRRSTTRTRTTASARPREHCGLLDQARTKATGYTPPKRQVPSIRTIFEPLSWPASGRRPA